MSAVTVLIALAGAFCYALAAAVQHRGCATAPRGRAVRLSLLTRLLCRPVGLVAIGAQLAGVGLHSVALSQGSLALVQPIGLTQLLFALPLGAVLWRRRISPGELGAAAAVVVGLGGLLVTVDPGPVSPRIDPARLTVALVGAGLFVVAVVTVAPWARGSLRAISLAIASGVCVATTAVLITLLGRDLGNHGFVAMLSWIPIALAGFAAAQFLLALNAYHTGSLATTLAVVLIVDPLAAAGFGAYALGQSLTTAHPLLVAAAASLIVVGVAVLVRETVPAPAAGESIDASPLERASDPAGVTPP